VIVAVPTPDPVTTPVVPPTVAKPEAVHDPPEGVLDIVTGMPTHMLEGPAMVVGSALTVTGVAVIQPAVEVNVMIQVPALIPVTTPVVEFTDAVAQALLHVPAIVLNSVVVWPIHVFITPVIAGGIGLTDRIAVAEHPLENAAVISVVPGFTPVATPVPPIITATDGVLLVQVAPTDDTREVVPPTHMFRLPVIAAGVANTVTTWVAAQPVPMA
jgi:hypothetical protein